MNKRQFIFSAIAATVLAACGGQQQNSSAPEKAASTPAAAQSSAPAADVGNKRLAITAIVEHPALDEVRQGVLAQLKAEGFEEGKNLTVDFQSAQGNPSTAAQIAKKFAGDKPDAVIAIGTPSAQAMAAASKDIPLVYAAVTDPVAAKLVSSWEASGTNVTGVSDQLPLEPQIDLMKKLVPTLKTVGYVYSPSEVNSTIVLDQLKTELAKHNMELAAVPAQRTTDVLSAARSLNGKAQLIYTSLDNNVVSSFPSMYKAATEMKIPVLASDSGSVPRGAVAALGVNYTDIGTETGKITARILKGEAAGAIPSHKMSKFDLLISPKHAQEQGIAFSDEIKQAATKVIE
ncbi:ABC transporter substrate-binding protein [Alysiella filiformis]|uniref:Putative ABC transport system substrate-binding protein n=1 Tax=Alysiella filiformis DSM 16848 TaxID=1120981 RepID=A0A286E7F5_9NEIS|nr:ABC transporter substrate-binding protein [Alysiella filiformis]QMT32408.1 ABC transporter substrate-binding protein [Alysiella filiformis]UBQ57351.1 ABC transporter substrate-binding protein [Alysiella filiformis DSM 16848]SOD66820.1 putative ABC transport system substrate-binding protein [Alysiella filiformis DSM 16848]